MKVAEEEEDILMKTNQILYDLMPDLLKYAQDLQPEFAKIVPLLVKNLGNPKVSSTLIIIIRELYANKLIK